MCEVCPRCGSAKMIPDVPLLDRYGDAGTGNATAHLKVQGEPKSWIFKDSAYGELKADICGDCGHAELRVSNFRELYKKYEKSRKE